MPGSSNRRWLKGLLVLCALVAIVWTAGWFGLRFWLDNRTETALANLRANNILVDCAPRAFGGFPFAMRLRCPQLVVDDNVHDYDLTVEGASGALSIFSPSRLVKEFAAPFNGRFGGFDVDANWQSLVMTTDLAAGGFDHLLAEGAAMTITTAAGTAAFASSQLRARPTAEGHLELAGRMKDVQIDPAQAVALPAIDTRFNLMLPEATRSLLQARQPFVKWLRETGEIDIRHLVISVQSGGQVALAGQLKVDASGAVSGDVTLGMADIEGFSRFVAEAAPELAPTLAGIAQGVSAIGQPAVLGDQEFSAIPIRIERGKVRVGFFEVGRLPPLW